MGIPNDVAATATDAVLKRLKTVYGVQQDTELAHALGVHKTTLHGWRRRSVVPYKRCKKHDSC